MLFTRQAVTAAVMAAAATVILMRFVPPVRRFALGN